MVLTTVWILLLVGLLVWGSVASYLRLLMRRLTPLQTRRLFQFQAGAKIQADRERVGVSISTLHGAAMHLFAVFLTGFFFYKWPGEILENLSASLAIVLAVIAIFDQLIPFRLVARHDEAEIILAKWRPFMRFCVYLALPLTFPILVSTTIARLLEPIPEKDDEPSAQENLQELIEAGRQEGLIEKSEGELIQSVMEFTDKVVREVMTPRPEIAALEINSPVDSLRRLFREKRLTRYPVYSGQLDHIEGIVNVRDLMELPPEDQSKVTLRSLLRPVSYVPETKSIRDLLKELQQTITQMAIVIDEYGSVSGLVTVEDMVEEIVGEIRDEVEPHARDISKETDSTWIVAGNTELTQISQQLHFEIESGDYSTVAGLLLARLGHVPKSGEKVALEGLTLEVLEASHRTVVKVRLQMTRAATPLPPTHARTSS
ncbi:MAG: HlyC/CorC family transporter [Acidobacteria bacterium]|nr:HlyC/CorC family transporter [Acidobacteriota bacterium]